MLKIGLGVKNGTIRSKRLNDGIDVHVDSCCYWTEPGVAGLDATLFDALLICEAL